MGHTTEAAEQETIRAMQQVKRKNPANDQINQQLDSVIERKSLWPQKSLLLLIFRTDPTLLFIIINHHPTREIYCTLLANEFCSKEAKDGLRISTVFIIMLALFNSLTLLKKEENKINNAFLIILLDSLSDKVQEAIDLTLLDFLALVDNKANKGNKGIIRWFSAMAKTLNKPKIFNNAYRMQNRYGFSPYEFIKSDSLLVPGTNNSHISQDQILSSTSRPTSVAREVTKHNPGATRGPHKHDALIMDISDPYVCQCIVAIQTTRQIKHFVPDSTNLPHQILTDLEYKRRELLINCSRNQYQRLLQHANKNKIQTSSQAFNYQQDLAIKNRMSLIRGIYSITSMSGNCDEIANLVHLFLCMKNQEADIYANKQLDHVVCRMTTTEGTIVLDAWSYGQEPHPSCDNPRGFAECLFPRHHDTNITISDTSWQYYSHRTHEQLNEHYENGSSFYQYPIIRQQKKERGYNELNTLEASWADGSIPRLSSPEEADELANQLYRNN